jgi:hypothetical protein
MSNSTPPPTLPKATTNGKDDEEETLEAATGKTLNKLTLKQKYDLFGIREPDHKMKKALKYVYIYVDPSLTSSSITTHTMTHTHVQTKNTQVLGYSTCSKAYSDD